ncbi:MAG: hypothetical protein FJZ63_00055 [Chlamydiae bacterium]|nr:hypothetical protein [Chlamydiota bacterium]
MPLDVQLFGVTCKALKTALSKADNIDDGTRNILIEKVETLRKSALLPEQKELLEQTFQTEETISLSTTERKLILLNLILRHVLEIDPKLASLTDTMIANISEAAISTLGLKPTQNPPSHFSLEEGRADIPRAKAYAKEGKLQDKPVISFQTLLDSKEPIEADSLTEAFSTAIKEQKIFFRIEKQLLNFLSPLFEEALQQTVPKVQTRHPRAT